MANSAFIATPGVASQAEMEAASSTSVLVTPGRQAYHPLHPKAWAYYTNSAGTYTLVASSGVASFVKNSTGNLTITLSTAMSSTSYLCVPAQANTGRLSTATPASTTTVTVLVRDFSNVSADGDFGLVVFGDQ